MNRWGTLFNKNFEFGHSTEGTRGEIWVKVNHRTGQLLIGHGRCVGNKDTTLMDISDNDPIPVDRFEVQGYVNTEADFNICHELCAAPGECDIEDQVQCPGMHGWTSTSTTVTTTTIADCTENYWRKNADDKECTQCSVLPSNTQTSCGQDELLIGKCGDDSNTWACEACKCDGGNTDQNGVCICPDGMFKVGGCEKGSRGFECKSCEDESLACNPFTQYRIGECGNNDPPYNTWDCHTCYIVDTKSKSCSSSLLWRKGDCKVDGEFTCAAQPTCGAGQLYNPGETTNDQATCEPCPGGFFNARTDHRALKCQPHKASCDEGEHMANGGEPTATTDLLCARHSECTKREYEVSPPSNNNDRVCAAISDCAPGSYVTRDASKSTDRQCGDCNGITEFSDQKNRNKCYEVGECYFKDERVVVEPTRTTDLECGPCPYRQVQAAETPHRERACSAPTTTTATTTTATATATTTTTSATSTTSTTLTTTTRNEQLLEVIAQAQSTYEKVALQAQECFETISGGTPTLYCSTAENCYDDCNLLEALSATVGTRLEAVRFGNVNLATETFRPSGLEPLLVPSWCKDIDVSCGYYGVRICSTSEASSCAEYCGCSEVTNTDASASNAFGSQDDPNAEGESSISTTTLVIIVAAIFVATVVGGAILFVKRNGNGAGGDGHVGIVAFENPMYNQQEPQYAESGHECFDNGEDLYDEATFAVGGFATDGYMDVEGVDN